MPQRSQFRKWIAAIASGIGCIAAASAQERIVTRKELVAWKRIAAGTESRPSPFGKGSQSDCSSEIAEMQSSQLEMRLAPSSLQVDREADREQSILVRQSLLQTGDTLADSSTA